MALPSAPPLAASGRRRAVAWTPRRSRLPPPPLPLPCGSPPAASGRERYKPLLQRRSSRTPPPRRVLRAPRKVPRLPRLSARRSFALLCRPHHLFGETRHPRERTVFGSAVLLPAAVVVLICRGASRPVMVGAVI
ncbi:hypothetical protein PVAP13_7NG353724 [Panicum virgatum]|uniref:Uncharacterized protein n=1 Tax=Panicum virgatum TaxID=38727 RepID=A0A8T0Q0I9_PANVG|nr:hypothetical protein PVAP13_7NG353724 [Panicum virgatum]